MSEQNEETVQALLDGLDSMLEARRRGEAIVGLAVIEDQERTIESLRADLAFERDHTSEAEAAALRKQVDNYRAAIANIRAAIATIQGKNKSLSAAICEARIGVVRERERAKLAEEEVWVLEDQICDLVAELRTVAMAYAAEDAS